MFFQLDVTEMSTLMLKWGRAGTSVASIPSKFKTSLFLVTNNV